MKNHGIRLSKETLLLVILVTFFRIFIDLDYAIKISPIFDYQMLNLNIDLNRYILSLIALYLPFPFVFSIRDDLPRKLVSMMYLTAFLPLTSFYALCGFSFAWLIMTAIFWILVSIASRVKFSIKLNVTKSYILLLAALLVFAIAVLLIVVQTFGISLKLNFSDVYELRAENTLSKIPLGGYIIPWTAAVVLPAIALIGMKSGVRFSRPIIILAIVCEIVLFGLTGHKSFIFSMFVILGLSRLMRFKHFVPAMALGLAALGGVVLSFDLIFSNYYMSSLLIRRVFFVPAQLSTFYYEYFEGRPIYLSNSIFSIFFDRPILENPSLAVGAQYFGGSTNANNGVMADGFMNFGVAGLIVWAITIGLIVSFAASISRQKDNDIAQPLILLSFYSFINSGLFTSLLTHGVILVLLIVFLLPKKTDTDRLVSNS